MSANDNSAGASAGKNAGNLLKEGFTKIHGLGEAIRGNINSFADSATNTDSTKSSNVAARGIDEIETGKYQGTGAGVTPHDTKAEHLNRNVQGEGVGVGTTGGSQTGVSGAGASTTAGTGTATGTATTGASAGTASGVGSRLDDGRFVK